MATSCVHTCAIVAALAIAAPFTGAQDTTRAPATSPDSLAERLRRAEEAIAVLREQIATQATSGVQSATRVRMELFGRVLATGFANSGSVNNADIPLFAVQPPPPDTDREGVGGSIRQTSLGVRVFVERVLGARFDGELHADFFGGQQPSSGGRNFPLLRIRTARAIMRWEHAEILFGQESPLILGVDPVSIAAFGTPEFVAAGNLWLWTPQLRATWTLWPTAPLRVAVQGAVLAPTTGDPVGTFDTELDPAERSSRPALQARLRLRWLEETDTPGEFGVGVHRAWVRRAADGSLVTSEAVGIDAVVPLGRRLEVRAEGYEGQALRGLGGGGISQSLTMAGAPVEDRGGWAQVEVKPSPLWSFGGGCGTGDPDDVAGLPGRRVRNRACETHLTLRPDGPLIASFAWRAHRTTYEGGTVARNTHLNLALGFEF